MSLDIYVPVACLLTLSVTGTIQRLTAVNNEWKKMLGKRSWRNLNDLPAETEANSENNEDSL